MPHFLIRFLHTCIHVHFVTLPSPCFVWNHWGRLLSFCHDQSRVDTEGLCTIPCRHTTDTVSGVDCVGVTPNPAYKLVERDGGGRGSEEGHVSNVLCAVPTHQPPPPPPDSPDTGSYENVAMSPCALYNKVTTVSLRVQPWGIGDKSLSAEEGYDYVKIRRDQWMYIMYSNMCHTIVSVDFSNSVPYIFQHFSCGHEWWSYV